MLIVIMDPNTEIRKLPPSIVREFCLILDNVDSWTKLMAIIPNQLSSNDYKCDCGPDNLPKYNSEHFNIIEQGGITYNRSCTEILFDEWGTSGKIRASLGHLKYLLIKAQLFRAADYVAQLLHEEPPPRPTTGPAARIPTNLSEIDLPIDPNRADLERQPQVGQENQKVENHIPVIPEIVVSEETCEVSPIIPPLSQLLNHEIVQQPDLNVRDVSEMIPAISILQENVPLYNSAELPAFSALLPGPNSTQEHGSSDNEFMPAFSQILPVESQKTTSNSVNDSQTESSLSSTTQSNTQSDLIPALSLLNQEAPFKPESDVIPNFNTSNSKSDSQNQSISSSRSTQSNIQSDLMPDLSILNQGTSTRPGSDVIPNVGISYSVSYSKNQSTLSNYTTQSNTQSDLIPAVSLLNHDDAASRSDLIPNFDMLQLSNSSSNTPLSVPQSQCSSKPSSSKCASPLPNLSLNTILPHFTYEELAVATNNFSSDEDTGTFLGAGSYGSVFLATGLLNQLVAVKKISLDEEVEVNEDDPVSKQFKNEVEVLCKYKHDNLVSLLGYSCDGRTYCLVYEYVPRGSLFEMLEKHPKNLSWKQRLHIALGTAKAAAYLHTAFSTPLIHRDIKSANILLDAENNAKLCDFGIVKLMPGQDIDLNTEPLGTSAYMSPEYHQNGEISVKLDTFSFGVVLLELLTSLPPLDYKRAGGDLVSYVENQCEHSIDPILDNTIGTWEENGYYFSHELYNLAQKCLDDKDRRPFMTDVVKSLEDMNRRMSS